MGKSKRNKGRRDAWLDDPLAVANADVRDAEELLTKRRRIAAKVAAARNGHSAPASPEEQAEEFFNRPGDFYIAQFEIDQTTTGGPVRAQCVLKADEAQRDYLVEVMRQVRGAFGERARISLSRAQTQQQRVTDNDMRGVSAVHKAAREAVRRRTEQQTGAASLWDLESAAADMLAPADPCPSFGCAGDAGHDGDHSHGSLADQIANQQAKNRDLTREELQAQLPGQTRAEVAAELGVDPADIGGEIKHADSIEIEQLAAELGVSPLDLQPIEMRGGGRVYAVKPRHIPPTPARHARPEPESETP